MYFFGDEISDFILNFVIGETMKLVYNFWATGLCHDFCSYHWLTSSVRITWHSLINLMWPFCLQLSWYLHDIPNYYTSLLFSVLIRYEPCVDSLFVDGTFCWNTMWIVCTQTIKCVFVCSMLDVSSDNQTLLTLLLKYVCFSFPVRENLFV